MEVALDLEVQRKLQPQSKEAKASAGDLSAAFTEKITGAHGLDDGLYERNAKANE